MPGKKAVVRIMLCLVIILLAFSALVGSLVFSKSARNFAIAAISENTIKKETNITYGPDNRHRLDIYKPDAENKNTPLVIFYYGGGWTAGNRDLYHFVGAALAKKGYTTIIPDYRLYPEVKFPEFVNDAALAYQWAWQKFVKDKSASRSIILIGHSAGAHIGALLSYDKTYLNNLGTEIPRPDGFIGLAGPYAFDPTTWHSTKEIFSTAKNADQARPIAFVDSSSPKTLLIHGVDDTTVRMWNANELSEKLSKNKVENQLVKLQGIGHLGIVTSIAKPLRWRASVLDEMVSFIRKFP